MKATSEELAILSLSWKAAAFSRAAEQLDRPIPLSAGQLKSWR